MTENTRTRLERVANAALPTYGPEYQMRIKPEPEYRPYKSVEEVLDDMAVHGPMVKTCGRYFAITEMDCERIWPNVSIGVEYAKMFNRYEWQDGAPFGRKEDKV